MCLWGRVGEEGGGQEDPRRDSGLTCMVSLTFSIAAAA